MANNVVPSGAYIGGNRQAMIVMHGDEEWVEIYQVEDLSGGRWHRNSKVSGLLSDAGLSAEVIATLPRYNQEDIPADFFVAQGGTVVILKAYRSNKEREAKAEPLETKEVSTKEGFDEVTKDFYDRGLYVGFYGKSGVQLKSAAARYLLPD